MLIFSKLFDDQQQSTAGFTLRFMPEPLATSFLKHSFNTIKGDRPYRMIYPLSYRHFNATVFNQSEAREVRIFDIGGQS